MCKDVQDHANAVHENDALVYSPSEKADRKVYGAVGTTNENASGFDTEWRSCEVSENRNRI